MKRVLLLSAVVAVASLAVFVSFAAIRSSANGGDGREWIELASVDELASRFNEDEGSIRIVLLLSPT